MSCKNILALNPVVKKTFLHKLQNIQKTSKDVGKATKGVAY